MFPICHQCGTFTVNSGTGLSSSSSPPQSPPASLLFVFLKGHPLLTQEELKRDSLAFAGPPNFPRNVHMCCCQ